MNPIISENLKTDGIYAYCGGRFWVYGKTANEWYVSDLAADEYRKALGEDAELTPEDFMTASDVFAQLEDWEVTTEMTDSLLRAAEAPHAKHREAPDANPTQAAPASPADAGAAAQSPSDAEAVSLAAESAPEAFDYSGLSPETVSVLRVAEREIRDARKTYICRVSAAVAAAHDELCGSCDNLSQLKHGNRGETTFGAWCSSVGIGRKTAERLLQVNALLSGATPDEQAALEAASPSLLYATAKPSAPAELVQGVKSGDITTHRQFKELEAQLKAEREARERADAERDEARAWAKKVEQDAAAAQRREEEARAAAHKYHVRAEDAEAQRNALLDQQTEYIDRIHELEARPVEVAVQQPTEEQIAAAAKQRTAMVEAQLHSVQERLDDALDRVSGYENGAYMAAAAFADSAARTVDSIRAAFWALAGELPEEDFSDALAPLDEAVRKICDREWEDEA